MPTPDQSRELLDAYSAVMRDPRATATEKARAFDALTKISDVRRGIPGARLPAPPLTAPDPARFAPTAPDIARFADAGLPSLTPGVTPNQFNLQGNSPRIPLGSGFLAEADAIALPSLNPVAPPTIGPNGFPPEYRIGASQGLEQFGPPNLNKPVKVGDKTFRYADIKPIAPGMQPTMVAGAPIKPAVRPAIGAAASVNPTAPIAPAIPTPADQPTFAPALTPSEVAAQPMRPDLGLLQSVREYQPKPDPLQVASVGPTLTPMETLPTVTASPSTQPPALPGPSLEQIDAAKAAVRTQMASVAPIAPAPMAPAVPRPRPELPAHPSFSPQQVASMSGFMNTTPQPVAPALAPTPTSQIAAPAMPEYPEPPMQVAALPARPAMSMPPVQPQRTQRSLRGPLMGAGIGAALGGLPGAAVGLLGGALLGGRRPAPPSAESFEAWAQKRAMELMNNSVPGYGPGMPGAQSMSNWADKMARGGRQAGPALGGGGMTVGSIGRDGVLRW